MGCIVSTVKLSCAQVVMKTWENTHWELLKPLYKQWSLYYYTYYNRISFSKISHTLPPIILYVSKIILNLNRIKTRIITNHNTLLLF